MTPFFAVLSFLLIALSVGVWSLWQRFVMPKAITDEDIESSVRMLLVRAGDPLRMARIETYQAWLDGDLVAQGKWRRVERVLKKRLTA